MTNTKVDWEKVVNVAGAVTAIAGTSAGIAYMVKAIIEMKQAANKADDKSDNDSKEDVDEDK